MSKPVLLTLFALTIVVGIAMNGPDAQANSGAYGCSGPELASYDYASCSGATASCAGERSILARRPVRRILRGAAAVATAPVRAVGRARFRPQGRFGRCG